MKTSILLFILLWVAFPAIHSFLFVFGMIGAFLWVAVTLRRKEEACNGSTWNGPNQWN